MRLQALFVNISTFYMEKHYRFVIKGKIVLTTSDESIFSTLSLSYDKSFMKGYFKKRPLELKAFISYFTDIQNRIEGNNWHPIEPIVSES